MLVHVLHFHRNYLSQPYWSDLPTDDQTHSLYHTLLGILFAYTYDARTTQHDPTPESAWTISTLTPAFSALDPPPYSNGLSNGASDGTFTGVEVSETLVRSYRRALAFPLYRSFALVNACRSDVAALLLKGKRTVVRCLLEVKHILDHHDLYYVYSKIWIDDFLVWTMAYARYVCFVVSLAPRLSESTVTN